MYRNYIEELNIRPEDILVYLRKSRADDPLLTVEEVLARHESILDEWAEKNIGSKVPEENKYREIVSGETIADRPEIQMVLKQIESPRIKAVLIVEVQRLSRGDLEDCGKLIKLLRYTNTLVITPHKIYDLTDEYDRDMFERELKRGNEFLEYTKKIMNRGRLRSVSEGNYVGSIAPYGYNKVWIIEGRRKCPTLAINKEQAPVVQMIFDMYVNQGIGIYNICNHLDEMGITPPNATYWSPHSIREMLRNIHYIGKVKWNWRKTVTVVEDSKIVKTRPKNKIGDFLIFDGKHEAIITEDLFNAAQEKIGKNHKTKSGTKIKNAFASLLYCQCGKAMTLRTYKTKDGSERCEPRLLCNNQVHCHTGSCTYSEMLHLVSNILNQSIHDFEIKLKDTPENSIKLHETILKNLEKKMKDLEAKELSQWEAQANPDPSQRMPSDIFKKLNEKILKEKEEVKEAIINARKSIRNPAEDKEKLHRFQDALDALLDSNIETDKKNQLLKSCIERIEYKRKSPYRQTKNSKPNMVSGWDSSKIELDVKLKV